MNAEPTTPETTLPDRAGLQHRNGWGAIPLPTGQKWPPATGFTGADAPTRSYADWYATWETEPDRWGNLGARIPADCVGVDVDAYGDKRGAHTWALLGGDDWPDTVTISSRFQAGYDGVSGIRLYRLPDSITQDMLWGAHDGIEILRHGHRYAVAPGSLHPEGGQYKAYDARTKEFIEVLPPVTELPRLTLEQAQRLTRTGAPWAGASATSGTREADPNPMCEYTMRILNRASADLVEKDSRYDTMSNAVWALILGEDEGHHLGQALEILHIAYYQAVAKDRAATGGEDPSSEYRRNVAGAREKVAANPTADMFKGCCGTGSTLSSNPPSAENQAPGGNIDDAYKQAVQRRYVEMRINEDARALLQKASVANRPQLTHVTLTDFLDQPDDDIRYRVEDMWPANGRVLLAAAAKTGKTTLVAGNLIPSLVDGTPFLGRYETTPPDGNIVLLNMEVGPNALRRWMRDSRIRNRDQVIIANLRGQASALAIDTEEGRDQLATWLRSIDAEIVCLDPLAPLLASLGLDENSNTDVARFFSYWAAVMNAAGVTDDFISHHTGHAGERSRGASRLLDEPDAIWTLTKATIESPENELEEMFAPVPSRFIQAEGRDVEIGAEELEFDAVTRQLTLTGVSKRVAQRSAPAENRHAVNIGRIRRLLEESESNLAVKSQILEALKGQKQAKTDGFERLLADGYLVDSGQVRSVNNRKYPLYRWNDGFATP